VLRADELGRAKEFSLAVFRAYWSEARDISSLEELARIGAACGLDGAEISRAVTDEAYRNRLEANTSEATEQGVFGVPTVICRSKLFFGNDRLQLLEGWLGGTGPQIFAR
jgi:2-hydroxychromene-2-carboxylate isomerase